VVRWLLAALVLTLAGYFFWLKTISTGSRLQVGKSTVKVEIRDDEAGRNLGLSGRINLAEDEGMLFVFDSPARHEFWMKDMNFPLDFVWINDSLVVDLSEHIPPPDKLTNEPPMTVQPKAPVIQVLEVNSGWIEQHQTKVGDRVEML